MERLNQRKLLRHTEDIAGELNNPLGRAHVESVALYRKTKGEGGLQRYSVGTLLVCKHEELSLDSQHPHTSQE